MKTDFPELVKTLNRGMEIGLHIGAVVHIKHRGETVADFAVGAACVDPVAELRPDQRMLWLSAGKPLTAIAVGLLVDRGRLSFDALVAESIPEFARNGKQNITVRHILTQTHAYAPPRIDWPRMSRDAIIDAICDAVPIEDETPGNYAAYDPQTGWFILSEIVKRVGGKPNHQFVRDEILLPLGCDTASVGMDAAEWTREREAGRIVPLYDTKKSARGRVDLLAVANGENPSDVSDLPAQWTGDDAQRAAARNPGGGAMGTAGDLATFYECLRTGGKMGDGTSLLREATLHEMTTRQRVGLKDHSFGQVVDWGLGFLINSARYEAPANPYGYGAYASDETFGHGGMQSSSAYADPVNELAVAIIWNGLPGEPKHQQRVEDTNTALYRDLGLA